MTENCFVYVAASLDGFIAKPDGDVDWLHNPDYTLPNNYDFGYQAFMAGIDALVMGRATFEKVLSFGEWPYKNTPVVVLTSRSVEIPVELKDKVHIENGDPDAIVSRLADTGYHHLYIDGGKTVQRFLKAGLINEIIITIIPILLGTGISLFGSMESELHLNLVEAKSFDNGFVQVHYKVEIPSK